MSEQGEEMRRKASALLKYANMASGLTDINFIARGKSEAMESRCEMLVSMSNQVLDVLPTLCEQIEKLSELAGMTFAENQELKKLAQDLSASLRSNPNVTTS